MLADCAMAGYLQVDWIRRRGPRQPPASRRHSLRDLRPRGGVHRTRVLLQDHRDVRGQRRRSSGRSTLARQGVAVDDRCDRRDVEGNWRPGEDARQRPAFSPDQRKPANPAITTCDHEQQMFSLAKPSRQYLPRTCISPGQARWDGWGSNPRLADYEFGRQFDAFTAGDLLRRPRNRVCATPVRWFRGIPIGTLIGSVRHRSTRAGRL